MIYDITFVSSLLLLMKYTFLTLFVLLTLLWKSPSIWADMNIYQNSIPLSCIMTKWLIDGQGKIGLDILKGYLSNLDTACQSSSDIEPSDGSTSCDTPDIVLWNGQVWSACNVWATYAYSGTWVSYPLQNEIGAYFRWWDISSTMTYTGDYFLYPYILNLRDDLTNDDGSLYISKDFRSEWWNNIDRQGPCSNGYQVPWLEDWFKLITFSENQNKSFQEILSLYTEIPIEIINSPRDDFNRYEWFWTSSIADKHPFYVGVNKFSKLWTINPNALMHIRCIKN